METDTIRERQNRWIETIKEGGGIGTTLLQHKLDNEWHTDCSSKGCLDTPIYTRTLCANEILFEGDSDKWDAVRVMSMDIIKTLDEYGIPYIKAFSGGKSVHIHIFFNPKIEIKLKKNTLVDVPKEVRMWLAKWILSKAWPRFYSLLDWSVLSWSTKRKGRMVRIFGCPREIGTTKTVIDTIPVKKITKAPAIFPQKIKLWNVIYLSEKINDFLKEREEQLSKIYQATFNFKGANPEKIPCIEYLLENGVARGIRDEALFTLLIFLKNIGVSPEEAQAYGFRFLEKCQPIPNDLIYGLEAKVRHVWRSNYKISRIKMNDLGNQCYQGGACELCSRFK